VLKISEIKYKLQRLFESHLALNRLEAQAEIEAILDFCTKTNRTERELKREQIITEAQLNLIDKVVSRRLQKIPLQYIQEQAYFFGLKFFVNSSVLIPRPETETLVELAIKLLKDTLKPQILEIGTGSGCISIALAKKLEAQIIATDICPEALKVAEQNALIHNVERFIKFEYADLATLECLAMDFDLVISNPPYIAESEFKSLAEEVKNEPYLALVGGNGLIYYERIAGLDLKTKYILLELDPKRSEEIKKIYEKQSFTEINLIKDLNGLKRYLKACK
jgi:release factor glutamine methyltransferase